MRVRGKAYQKERYVAKKKSVTKKTKKTVVARTAVARRSAKLAAELATELDHQAARRHRSAMSAAQLDREIADALAVPVVVKMRHFDKSHVEAGIGVTPLAYRDLAALALCAPNLSWNDKAMFASDIRSTLKSVKGGVTPEACCTLIMNLAKRVFDAYPERAKEMYERLGTWACGTSELRP